MQRIDGLLKMRKMGDLRKEKFEDVQIHELLWNSQYMLDRREGTLREDKAIICESPQYIPDPQSS